MERADPERAVPGTTCGSSRTTDIEERALSEEQGEGEKGRRGEGERGRRGEEPLRVWIPATQQAGRQAGRQANRQPLAPLQGLRRVFACGLKFPPTSKLAALSTILPAKDYAMALEARGRGSVLLLGDDALHSLDPRTVRRDLPVSDCRLVLGPRLSSYAVVAAWERVVGSDSVEVEDVERRVLEEAAVPLRTALPRDAWCPRILRIDETTERILAAIPHLGDLSPAGLGGAVHMEQRTLHRACPDRFGLCPEDLVWCFKEAYFLQQYAAWESKTRIAFALGYADRTNLNHALRKKGVEPPPRRPRAGSEGV